MKCSKGRVDLLPNEENSVVKRPKGCHLQDALGVISRQRSSVQKVSMSPSALPDIKGGFVKWSVNCNHHLRALVKLAYDCTFF